VDLGDAGFLLSLVPLVVIGDVFVLPDLAGLT
jgi:hypothetical protein